MMPDMPRYCEIAVRTLFLILICHQQKVACISVKIEDISVLWKK